MRNYLASQSGNDGIGKSNSSSDTVIGESEEGERGNFLSLFKLNQTSGTLMLYIISQTNRLSLSSSLVPFYLFQVNFQWKSTQGRGTVFLCIGRGSCVAQIKKEILFLC